MDDTSIQIPDEQVVSLIQKGDKEKFAIIMERYDKKLSRYGRKFLSDADNIEDIVQDIFINAYKSINNFDDSLRFSSWIYRIAHNAFVNGLRQKNRSLLSYFDFDLLVSHHIYEDPVILEREYEEMKKMIDVGLEQLKPKYKEVIILHYLEEMSYREISDILKIPVGTVGIRVMRGKENLKKFYENNNMKYGQ